MRILLDAVGDRYHRISSDGVCQSRVRFERKALSSGVSGFDADGGLWRATVPTDQALERSGKSGIKERYQHE